MAKRWYNASEALLRLAHLSEAEARGLLITRAREGQIDVRATRYRRSVALDRLGLVQAQTKFAAEHNIIVHPLPMITPEPVTMTDVIVPRDFFVEGFAHDGSWEAGDMRSTAAWATGDFARSYISGFEKRTEMAEGVWFDAAMIDAIVPPFARKVTRPAKPGPLPKFDWEVAFVSLLAMANTADGLPEGHGAMAKMIDAILDEFAFRNMEQPSREAVRQKLNMWLNDMRHIMKR